MSKYFHNFHCVRSYSCPKWPRCHVVYTPLALKGLTWRYAPENFPRIWQTIKIYFSIDVVNWSGPHIAYNLSKPFDIESSLCIKGVLGLLCFSTNGFCDMKAFRDSSLICPLRPVHSSCAWLRTYVTWNLKLGSANYIFEKFFISKMIAIP